MLVLYHYDWGTTSESKVLEVPHPDWDVLDAWYNWIGLARIDMRGRLAAIKRQKRRPFTLSSRLEAEEFILVDRLKVAPKLRWVLPEKDRPLVHAEIIHPAGGYLSIYV